MAYIAAETCERFLNQDALHVFDAHFIQFDRGFARGTQTQIARANLRTLRHQHGALDRMVELANVARPRMIGRKLQRDRLETFELLAITLRRLPQEMVREERNVFLALAQRREMNLDRVQAE